MTDEPSNAVSTFAAEMQAGHMAREKYGDHNRAVTHYLKAGSLATDKALFAQAYQAAGVSYRVLGRFDEALAALSSALEASEAIEPSDDRLMGAIHRDLGVLHHELALKFEREDALEVSRQEFGNARFHFAFSATNLLYDGDRNELAATNGFWGMALFDAGEKAAGIRRIAYAAKLLALLPGRNSTYELNNLIRYMRVSLLGRWASLPRALQLTKKGAENAGSRKRVLAALGGNRIYKWLQLRQRQM